ncbi:hypothetical protein P4E94_15285 [Pontiellaceae bacterium B12219]|nr:hypothetical protein [Pontiellaceae bacterium B12219]
MDDKKFTLLISGFAVVSLVLVLGLLSIVLLDIRGRQDASSVVHRGGGAADRGASLMQHP